MRVSRKNLPTNVTIRWTKTIGPRNRQIRKKKVTFAPSTTQRVAKRTIRKYKTKEKEKHRLGGSILGNLAKLGIKMGSKVINSKLEEKNN